MLVNIYTKPNCPACTKTKNHLTKTGIDHEEAPITPEVLNYARKKNFTQAPIVTVYRAGDTIDTAEAWCGYKPEKINTLAKEN